MAVPYAFHQLSLTGSEQTITIPKEACGVMFKAPSVDVSLSMTTGGQTFPLAASQYHWLPVRAHTDFSLFVTGASGTLYYAVQLGEWVN